MPHTKGVYIAILNQGQMRVELVHMMIQLTRRSEFNIYYSFPADKPISQNRNKIVLDFLNHKELDYLMMIDSDIIPLSLDILHLIDHQKDIIAPVMFAYRQDAIVPLVLKRKRETAPDKIAEYNVVDVTGDEGLIEVDAVGTGCIIIHRRVLEHPQMKAPFLNQYDENGLRILGLDLNFCKRAKELGFKVWCHLDYQCSHWTVFDLKEVYESLTARELQGGRTDANFEMKGLKGKVPTKKLLIKKNGRKKK